MMIALQMATSLKAANSAAPPALDGKGSAVLLSSWKVSSVKSS